MSSSNVLIPSPLLSSLQYVTIIAITIITIIIIVILLLLLLIIIIIRIIIIITQLIITVIIINYSVCSALFALPGSRTLCSCGPGRLRRG